METEAKLNNENDKIFLDLTYKNVQIKNKIFNIYIKNIDLTTYSEIEISKIHDKEFVFDGNGKPIYPLYLSKTSFKMNFDIKSDKIIYEDITPPKEMTVDEIEKQLGHKIKIVSKE